MELQLPILDNVHTVIDPKAESLSLVRLKARYLPSARIPEAKATAHSQQDFSIHEFPLAQLTESPRVFMLVHLPPRCLLRDQACGKDEKRFLPTFASPQYTQMGGCPLWGVVSSLQGSKTMTCSDV